MVTKNEDADDKRSEIATLVGRCTSKRNELHLILGEADEAYFRENIQLLRIQANKKEKKRSHEHIRQALFFSVISWKKLLTIVWTKMKRLIAWIATMILL